LKTERDPNGAGALSSLPIETLRRLVERSHEGVLVLTGDGRIVYANPMGARSIGYSVPELLGKKALDLLDGGDRDAGDARLVTALQEGESGDWEERRLRRKDGSVMVGVGYSFRTTLDGRPALVLVGRDQTDRLKAELGLARSSAALQRAEAMSTVGRLVSAVAHEVRNPLFAITSTLDSLLAALPEDPFPRRCAAVLREEVAKLTDLTRDLLEYGKPRPPAFVVYAVEEVVQRVVASGAEAAQARSVQVVHRVEGALPRARMDPGRLSQVFQNLIDNAIRHAPADTEVAVTGAAARRWDGEWIVYQVRDHGPGFREEDLPRVFEPFFSRRYGGTGLGLSIVQQICEAHGGLAEVGNEPGGGAVVTVRLPAHRAEDRAP
jgi:PAS domain S-box-containing protein